MSELRSGSTKVCATAGEMKAVGLRGIVWILFRTQCCTKEEMAEHQAECDTLSCATQATHQEARTVKDTYTGL